MTGDTATQFECPSCHTFDSVDLSDGVRLCLQCRTEWRPADIVQLPPPAPQPAALMRPGFKAQVIMQSETAAEVLDVSDVGESDADVFPLALVELGEEDQSDWSDKFARLDDGRTVLILDDDGRDQMVGQLADGSTLDVWRHRCVLLGDEPVGIGAVALAHDADEPLPQTILAVAGLCLTVALECVPAETDTPGEVKNPRIGWLPPPCDQVPEAECGVAYAAALLISVFGLDREQVQRLAANLLTGAESGLETEGQ